MNKINITLLHSILVGTAWAFLALLLPLMLVAPAPAAPSVPTANLKKAEGARSPKADAPKEADPAKTKETGAHKTKSRVSSPPVQVRVEVRIVEWQVDDSLDFDFAVQYQRAAGAGNVLNAADLTLPADPMLSSAARVFLSNMDAGNGSFDAVIEMLKGVGKVRVLSQPSIILTSRDAELAEADLPAPPVSRTYTTTMRGETASANAPWAPDSARLSNTVQVPYALNQYVSTSGVAEVTMYRDTGVTMDVVVQCVKGNLIFLDTRATVSDVTDYINVACDARDNPQAVPVINSRTIQNRMVIPDRTILIAGLMKTTREVENRSGIPWISELPVFRWFLSNTKKKQIDAELVFLIKTEILSPYRAPGAVAILGGPR